MKTLYIVRHAKASLKSGRTQDIDRPLIIKGETNTKFVTDYLRNQFINIDLIISSHAKRAFDTAKLFAIAFSYPEDNIKVDTQIYHKGVDALFNQFYDLPDELDSLMLVGHNPSITSFANYFIEDKIENLPTSGIICINFATNKWQNIPKAVATEIFRVFPKILKKTIKYAALAV